MKRLKSALTALVVLALSATAVFASHALPQASSSGLANAANASGQTVPGGEQEQGNGAENGPDQDEKGDTDSDTDKAESNAPETESATHPDNHGKLVSEAAHLTEDQIKALGTFANHGAYVSSVAKKNAGQANSATHRSGHGKPSSPGKSGQH